MSAEQLINRLRESHPMMTRIFTNGSCYQLFLILKTVFPQAVCWYDPVIGHAYTEIDGRFYDITGRIYNLPQHAQPFCKENWPKHAPHRWQPLELVLKYPD